MALSFTRNSLLSRALRNSHALKACSRRPFSTTLCAAARQSPTQGQNEGGFGRRTKPVIEDDMEELWENLEEPDSGINDSPTIGHLILQEQRQVLYYMRLIEHEMPKLVAYRKPFIPPTAAEPVIVRSMHYQGEVHPAMFKRVVVAALDQLPLKSADAVHKFKLLAGPRWTPNPPADAGVSGLDDWGNGYVKIACEDLPTPAMNLKWASDALDKLIEEANKEAHEFKDIPVDLRHVLAKTKKAKKGDHLQGQLFHRPSIRDFPKEWLPQTLPQVQKA